MSTKLSHGPARIIAKMLWANRVLGTDPTWWITHQEDPTGVHAWPVGYQNERESPDNVITVYETTPQFDARIMTTGENVIHHGITIRVRGNTDEVAGQKARDIEHDLAEAAFDQQVTLDSTQYLIPCIPKIMVIPALRVQGSSRLWFVNINCLAVIRAYPIQG